MGISVSFANYMPAERWVFCRRTYLNSPNLTDYCIARQENINIITNTTIVNYITLYNNTRFFAGPGIGEVEKATRVRITPVDIVSIANAGAANFKSGSPQTHAPGQAGGGASITGQPTRHAVYNKNRPQPMQPRGSNPLPQ
jgi:hypothetical protein